jgi:uncharacterized protein (DUF2252 family)
MKNKSKNYPSFAERSTVLHQCRNLKMASSAHAYVRGNTPKFYEWLAEANDTRVPLGPPVWICGDCHVGNLGPLADTDGQIDIQIRDLDQSIIGNPAHDLIRLGLSLAMAARGSDLPGIITAKMIEQLTEGGLPPSARFARGSGAAVFWYRRAHDLGATAVASRLKRLEAKEGRN